MNYTYALTQGTSILRSDGANIPLDPANTDYAAYLVWVAAGNTPTPVDPTIIAALTQARFASQAQTLLDKSDKTLLRCLEHGITPSAELLAYRVALRQVVGGTLSTIPTIPAYQVGT
jgi:fructose-1-phosphate kinase PfkB-like protein